MNEVVTKQVNDFVIKIRQPEGNGPFPVVMLLHGWTGDENSMWVFGSQLPQHYLLIAPRAPYISKHPEYGGYSWVERSSGNYPWFEDFRPSLPALDALLDELSRQYEGDFSKINLTGFSQGAALSYVFALLNPVRINKVAGLAGFLPLHSDEIVEAEPLNGTSIFMAHGRQDETVPLSMAHEAKDKLTRAGGIVSLCESDAGHKLGSECFKAFLEFMS
jgi:phospholipase/carboxylesterase